MKTFWLVEDINCGAKVIFDTEKEARKFVGEIMIYTIKEYGFDSIDLENYLIEEIRYNLKTPEEFYEYY